jgi:AmmeMemoRadiSam system protein B
LLLPGVAVEHHLDAIGFLRQVCHKAGLSLDAWKSDDTLLSTFEGYAIQGKLNVPADVPAAACAPVGPSPAEVAALAGFCRGNLAALLQGATPSFYLPGGYDGGVNGAVLTVQIPGRSSPLEVSKMSFRPEMPLQATLYGLTQAAAQSVQAQPVPAGALEKATCELSVFWDPAMHGTLATPDLQGVDSRFRAVMVTGAGRWAVAFDPKRSAAELLDAAAERARLRGVAEAAACSFAAASSQRQMTATNVPLPQTGPSVRSPAVAGRFYPGNPHELNRMLDEMIPAERGSERWAAAMIPHAGWVYSGRLAAAVLARVCIPSRVIVIAPKHHAGGADWAVAPHRLWALPGRNVESDPELARQLAEGISDLALDAEAHRGEHAVEVQLPILARLAPQAKVVGIVLGGGSLERLQRFAEQLAGVLRALPERPLLVVSSDMSHEQNRGDNAAYARQMDRVALDAMKTLDPAELFHAVAQKGITMCGFRPAVVAMETLRRLDCLHRCEEVAYATSADSPSGRADYVVGYAGMLLGE